MSVVTHYVLGLVWAVALGLCLRLVYVLVAYLVVDGETRKSMRQAWLIRLRWRRLSRMLGLVVIDPTPTLLGSLFGHRTAEIVSFGPGLATIPVDKRGHPAPPRVLAPRIRVKADEYGVVIMARTLPKVGREEWVKAADHLANAWGCVRVAVTQAEPGRLIVRAVRRDPLVEPYTLVPSGLPPASLDRWSIGRDEYAGPVEARFSNVPGVCVAGLPGYGKTSLINCLLATVAPSAAIQVAVVDGKGGADYEDMQGRFFAMAGDDLVAANRVFKHVYELRRRRSECIRAMLGVKNMWHVGPSQRWPLVILVIDEAHTFLAEIKGDKDLGALTLENRRLVEDIVKKGRSVGIIGLLATQKSTGDAIPTAIRDVCPVALSFAQRTDEAAVAALGADIRQYPEANPVALQDPAYVGVASMVVQGRPGFVRVRTPYVSDQDVARICAATARLARDPMDLLSGAAGSRTALLGSDDDAPAWGEDRNAGAVAGASREDAEDAA
jgi:S-DNA-T family DNA segregation ATPase FtsK/SpoIIIE